MVVIGPSPNGEGGPEQMKCELTGVSGPDPMADTGM